MPDGSNREITAPRASTTLTIKGFDDVKGIIEGIATTPTPDRVGDIVDPKGAVFKLPLPLLWQHQSGQPIGKVIEAKVTAAGIWVKCKIELGLLPEIDRAFALIKSGLVDGFSIGFRGLDDGVEPINPKEPWGAVKFLKWEWLELSAVTIAANGEASIQTIKSAFGASSGDSVVRLGQPIPGASGTSKPKGLEMKTIQEKIASWEAKRQSLEAARTSVMQKAENDGDRTLTAEEKAEYDRCDSELKEVDDHLSRLRAEADRVKATAAPVDDGVTTKATPAQPDRTPHLLSIKGEDDEAGIAFARYVKCHILSKGIPMIAENIAKSMYPNDQRLHGIVAAESKRGAMFTKADVLGGSTTGTTWAAPLWQYVTIADAFLEWLRPQTIIGKMGVGGVPGPTRVPFNARVGQQTSGGTGYWVGEGKPKPLTSFNFNAITMAITKVAAIAVLTQEIMRLSGGDADRLVRNALRGALIERLDRDFIDPDFAGVANVSPASITYGAPSAAASGVLNSHFLADTGTAVDTVLASFPEATLSGLVWLMSGRQGYRIGRATNSLGQRQFDGVGLNGGGLDGIPVVTSEYLAYGGGLSPGSGNLMVLVHAPSIFLADDGEVSVLQSTEASLQMLDNPTNDSVTPTPTTMVSMFQTNSVALLAERAINWKRARDGAVYVITGAAYTGAAA
jgi:HK97 family phage major capsid protein/HK97 family phage prohead protease